jgi:hypothetical protein
MLDRIAGAGDRRLSVLGALVLALASILLVGLLEMLPDRRLAILAVVMIAVACGIVCCTVIKV